MRTPRKISSSDQEALWKQVRDEFPDDEMMQEVHFVRLLHAAQLEDFTLEERAEYFNRLVPHSSEADSSTDAPPRVDP